MLYDLSFLDKGKPFPPKGEGKRIKDYNKNFKYYDGDYSTKRKVSYDTFNDSSKQIEFDVMKVNMYKLVTNKFIALLLNEKPIVKVNGESNDKKVEELLSNSNFWGVLQKTVTAFSSLGDGIINTYNSNVGPRVVATTPSCWYKVVNQSNIEEVLYHVLMWKIDNNKHLRVQVHERGRFKEYICEYSGNGIGDKITYKRKGLPTISKRGRVVKTGLTDFAVVSMSNNTSVNKVYGISDYKDIENLVTGVEKRLALEDKVIDKHIEPTFTGPSSMMTENEQTGKAEFTGIGGFVPVQSKDSPQPQYVTWDGKTEASEKLIDRYMQLIYTITEYGEVFFTGGYANASGEALKTLLKSALDKVSRQIDTINHPTKLAIKSLLELDGVQVSISDISISWQDGINESLKTITDTINTRVTAGTLSLQRSLMQYDKMTEEQANDEINRIIEEKKVSATVETKTKEEGGTT